MTRSLPPARSALAGPPLFSGFPFVASQATQGPPGEGEKLFRRLEHGRKVIDSFQRWNNFFPLSIGWSRAGGVRAFPYFLN